MCAVWDVKSASARYAIASGEVVGLPAHYRSAATQTAWHNVHHIVPRCLCYSGNLTCRTEAKDYQIIR